ncbi:2-hydroxy-3-oxopropionate reductase [Limnohabitans sp. Jir61]|jgi:3-hydroxyisobutyrate dehydrogenase-like beta-hydroxyacid dehydrogenase|uniref:NAD(P)-dependent oxidoreductase n=1 Tax=Limnohabitans sp. Jir61 TaxID=1826168 RepID=UPI000D38F128|nr:NAD(P)-dependent oxidoreductase [Limnohabitans sp. Jir61]PUE32677.1 2-hydroxy-3-oxopropionate reductase [Limnohabitans sp. Jir61]
MTTIGMIGIGMMGHGIASNLVKHGHALSVLAHAGNQPIDDLLQQGVKTFTTPQDLAAHSDVVILCVTGTPQVEAVLMGEDGVLKGLRPNTIVIDCSTAMPASTEKIAQAVAAQGGLFMDAPMTRTPKEAAEGRLNLLVGADAALFETCRPILACFAENIVHVGPVGSGHRMKLLHNYVSLGSVALLAEAAACAQVGGVNAQTFVDVLTMGGGWGAALERLRPFLLNHDNTGLRFTVANALKDLTYYNDMAQDMQAEHVVASAIQTTLKAAYDEGQGALLMPDLVDVFAQRSH